MNINYSLSSSKNQPIFTIIVAVFNGEKTLQRCINSVASQTYSYRELIIIDGGSHDRTVDILKVNQEQITYWESESDRGIYHAFNKGVLKAQGDWIIFLGSDDYLWDSDVLTKVTQELAKLDSKTRLIYGKVAMVSLQKDILQIKGNSWEKSNKAYRYYHGCDIDHQGVFQHCSLFQKHGLFDESFKICGDYEFLLRELKNNDPQFLENILISGKQIGGVSTQHHHGLIACRECERARQKNSLDRLFFLPHRLYFYIKEYLRIFIFYFFKDRYAKILIDIYRIITLRNPVWTKL